MKETTFTKSLLTATREIKRTLDYTISRRDFNEHSYYTISPHFNLMLGNLSKHHNQPEIATVCKRAWTHRCYSPRCSTKCEKFERALRVPYQLIVNQINV